MKVRNTRPSVVGFNNVVGWGAHIRERGGSLMVVRMVTCMKKKSVMWEKWE